MTDDRMRYLIPLHLHIKIPDGAFVFGCRVCGEKWKLENKK